jgi:predicted dehydrogenase
MPSINRREFLQDTTALAALLAGTGVFAAPAATKTAAARKKGDANDKLHVAVIGVHGRGMSHVGEFAGGHDCLITTICDCDSAVIGPAMRRVEQKQGKPPRYEQDIRRVMDDKSIDIITIAMPNHWHALAAIWGLQSGKHVYVEKPVSHNVSEGRRIVEAAEKYGKICQTGTQSRSSGAMREAIEFLHSGKIGQVKLARAFCYKLRPSIGKVNGPQPVPSTVDYDLWCGPAPLEPLMRKKLHYDWHWQWNTGNGDLGNQGIHEMDKARWGLGKNELARSAISIGGRLGYEDDGQTANTQICAFDYGDCELIFEVRGLVSKSPFPGVKSDAKPTNYIGNIWYAADGLVVAGDKGGVVALDNKGEVIQKFGKGRGENHFGNFVKAVRSGKRGDLNADILEGHLSSALCHLGNISYALGNDKSFNDKSRPFGDDKAASEVFANMTEHLNENGVPVEKLSYRAGKKLTIDPKAERFVKDDEANGYLTRDYRKLFVVPERV